MQSNLQQEVIDVDDYSPVKPTISVVVPVFNEEENIAAFHRELTRTIDTIVEYDWEVIFVDDGSRDDTVAEVLALREHDCRVKCVQLSRNFGSHAALLAGLSNCSGAAAVMMSVDLQDPPELIREFLVEWKKRNHIVWGVRKTRDDPWSKKVLANLFYVVCRRILPGFPAGGMDCGLFDRQVIRELFSIN
jgi:polyisoprenyl-phosphate glycosyltransferase